MSFDTLPPALQEVADLALKYCKTRYGRNGVKENKEIHRDISWRPTFQLRPATSILLAFEVDDQLYPEILKIGAHDILRHDHPISASIVCPLDVYMADTKQKEIIRLRRDGFGIITVDDEGIVAVQQTCIPLAQHIPEREMESGLRGLTPTIKTRFRAAHQTYSSSEIQGLQEAGQIVESIIQSMAEGCTKKGYTKNNILTKGLADVIDELYDISQLRNHRAALGDARAFTRNCRNVASHPPRSPREAMERIRICRGAFLDSIRVTTNLREAMKKLGFRVRIH